jgi:hypothetical protein
VTAASQSYVRCRACGHRVYYGARRCTHCNRRLRRNRGIWVAAVILAVLLGLALADWLASDQRPAPETTLEDR